MELLEVVISTASGAVGFLASRALSKKDKYTQDEKDRVDARFNGMHTAIKQCDGRITELERSDIEQNAVIRSNRESITDTLNLQNSYLREQIVDIKKTLDNISADLRGISRR